MFTIRLQSGVVAGYEGASAEAASLPHALRFVGEFCASQHLLIEAPWVKRDGQYVMDVYDWCDCWFTGPPILAQIIAPPGFTPPGADVARP